MILLIGGSLGAGPWRCDQLVPQDAGPGSGSAALIPPPSPPPSPIPLPPSPPPPAPPRPTATPPPPAAPPIATTPRREEPTGREPLGPRPPAPPPASRAVIPDEVIMRAVRTLHPTFVACWRRAQRNDPTLVSARVRISLEVDATGAVTSSRTDAEDVKLSRCLAGVARKLAFPSLGRAAAVDVPLFF